MKKIYSLILFTAAIMFAGCNGNEPEKVKLGFEYQKIPPFTYKFINKSSGADSYKWDFGDGTYATTRDAEHTYSATGTYIVTLTATKNGEKYDNRVYITVSKPKIYLVRCVLYDMPYENKYYKIVCKDDDLLTTNWGFTTTYSPLLDNTDLPFYWNINKLMNELDGDNYYTFQVFWSNNTTSDGTQCLKQKLQKTEILKYKSEHILSSDNGQTKIGIQMRYE